MDRSRLVPAVVGGFAIVLFATVATSDPVRIADRAPSMPFAIPEIDLTDRGATTTTTLPAGGLSSGGPEAQRSWDILTSALETLLIIGLAVGLLRLLAHGWRHRPQLVWRPRREPPAYVLLEEVAANVVGDAEAQRALLRSGTARNGIVECWLRLEAAIEASGIDHDPTLTPTELTAEVLARFEIDAGAAERLAALYREARFSTHELDEVHRAAALDALDVIHDGLRRSRSAVTNT